MWYVIKRGIGETCPNRNIYIYISEILILLKTYFQKLGYILFKTYYSCIYLGW